MFESFSFAQLLNPGFMSQATAFVQVVFIDLVMAGDNAVAVGLAAAGLAAADRKKAIMWGLIAAVIMRIGFVLITAKLLLVIGLLFAGGLLLLWVGWKMWRELREQEAHARAEANLEDATGVDINSSDTMGGAAATPAKPKSFRTAVIQILVADLSMSLDNVLAVAGAAHAHPEIMVFGLILAIALMGVAAHAIANVLHKYRWIGYIGLLVILYVAMNMMWEGHRDMVVDLKKVKEYNEIMPDFVDITPKDIAHFSPKK